jgi:Spy/CpxP family protein refolding chaperone
MKKLLVIAMLFVSAAGFAQSNKEDIDFIQSIYGKEKKEIVAGFIKLEGAQKDAFWKLYDEYETQRKDLGKQRVALLERYANSYMTLDDATTDQIMKDMMSLGIKTDKLMNTYYGKMKKASGVKAAAQFVQIEAYLLSAVRATLMENIPFIGELN